VEFGLWSHRLSAWGFLSGRKDWRRRQPAEACAASSVPASILSA
jgi:hypothetical protein